MPHSFPLLQRIAQRAQQAPTAPAIVDTISNRTIDYATLYADICNYSLELEAAFGQTDLQDARVGILAEKGYPIVVALLATFAAGGLAIPLLTSLPQPEHHYMLSQGTASLLLYDDENQARADALKHEMQEGTLAIKLVPDFVQQPRAKPININSMPELSGDRKAMMLFTSGTTGRPKGVVTRHSALSAQVSSIVKYWEWNENDLLYHVLPLNHLHGIVVALLTTLWAGAAVELHAKLLGEQVWRRWINKDGKPPITLMFGVPTVYTRLISAYDALPESEKEAASAASASLRLQVSGSAPLPESVKRRWDEEVGGGQVLLERYGMTETGILLSTGFHNAKRIAGHVGFPLPGVHVRLFNKEENRLVEAEEEQGEIQVKGPGIFNEYWNLPEVTAAEFEDGEWFKTGDIGVLSKEHPGMYKIFGRSSVDIIKSGGEKLSALDVERALLELDYITDAAVVGVPNEEWGQIVGAIVVASKDVTLEDIRRDLRSKIAVYKVPRALRIYSAIPRNAMGKIAKKTLVQEAFGNNNR
ncbi:hypothetical protein NliqN6_1916 [Naganishia liquefaciens]|uniref:AMP-binding protein n=1 Tax=Naganishia liquefaciens TaxID=104408 RepID=A0A8H3TR92_9TREE|nr:hypothetical protein NliqN6_1916 [Naganishia liquefaciens]